LGKRKSSIAGITLIEVILVISLMAFMLVVMAPNITLSEANEVSSKLGKLSSDFRSAYDSAVLSGKTHRLGFDLGQGTYWLEMTDSNQVKLGASILDRELTPEEEQEKSERFDQEFERFVDLADRAFPDPETGKDIVPESPVLQAKAALKGPKWKLVESGEWGERQLGDILMFRDIQAFHHVSKISLADARDKAIAYIYFFPSGYIEPAFLHLAYKGKDGAVNEQKSPYTIVINSYEGYVDIKDGYVEVSLANPE